jgi:hypothetical protein
MGPVEASVEGIKAVAPGLSLSKILGDVGEELGHQLKHGSHEMAAALFNGSPFVMYPRQNNAVDNPIHGLTSEAQKEVEHERGGMSM